MTPEIRAELLKRVNPEQTKSIAGLLPLHVGMRLTLLSKDCVRFGLTKGCTCCVEKIILSDAECLPETLVAGEPHQLTYMPISLLLRAEDVDCNDHYRFLLNRVLAPSQEALAIHTCLNLV